MSGPPPKPTALKVLQGNAGHRPLNDREPKPRAGAEPPDSIKADPALLKEWNRHAPRLLKLGLLTEIDDDALAMLCCFQVAFAEWVKGDVKTGALIELSKELRALWARFGMTPADRSRVKVDKPAPETKLSRYVSGGKG